MFMNSRAAEAIKMIPRTSTYCKPDNSSICRCISSKEKSATTKCVTRFPGGQYIQLSE